MDLHHYLFYQNLDVIFFVYGLAFIVMGITVLIQPKQTSEFDIANILWLLGIFGITHGLNEFLDMWAIIKGKSNALDQVRWGILLLSYAAFFEFGRRLFCLKIPDSSTLRKVCAMPLRWWLLPVLILFVFIAGLLSSDFWNAGSIWTRYLLGLPGGILIGFGFHSYYYTEERVLEPLRVKKYFFSLGIAFLAYGVLGGTIVPKGDFFPADVLNTETFLAAFRVPVQALRAVCAITIAWALTGIIKIFNWEIRSRLQEAQNILREQLKESEARYMEIVESSSDIIHSIDKDNLIVNSNTPGCEILGYTKEELAGKNIKLICSPVTSIALEDEFQKTRREGSAFLDHGQLVRKNGEHVDVAIHSIAMFDNKRNFLGIRLTFRDITARKQIEEAFLKSEERYRLLFEESRDAIYITTREGEFIDINQSGLDLFGYSKDEIMAINPNQLYIEPDDRIKFQRAIEKEEFERDYAIHLRKKSGKIMDCLITASLRRSGAGDIIGFQGIIRDVTERKKMEEELQKIEKLESIGIMAGGIAHDFNNILTTIAGNISLASVSVRENDKLSEILSDTRKACKHAKNLTDQLLIFSRGGAPIKKRTDMKGILNDSVNFALRGSNITCVNAIADNLWSVEVDKGQIMQVVHNLAINAKQSMPEGGTVRIVAENMPAGQHEKLPPGHGDYIRIGIEDEGVGIPKEHIKKIFDPFFTTKENGSGLGLSCTYSIIKNHDGLIDVHSDIGNGTSFYIYLPASAGKTAVVDNSGDAAIRGSGYILVMDDEENVRKSVGKMLKYLGYEVELAKNGDETIELYKKAKGSLQPFDAVIMDLTIRGGKGGKETIEKLHEIDPGVKAIVSSGYSSDPVMADYREFGFRGVIPKPYEIEDLSILLHNIINMKTESRRDLSAAMKTHKEKMR